MTFLFELTTQTHIEDIVVAVLKSTLYYNVHFILPQSYEVKNPQLK